MNIYEFIDNKFSDDDMYRSNVARRGISRIAGKGVEQMQGGNRNREGGSMNKKSHEEELQEHINALEQKLEEEVKENIKHLGDLRYYEEVQIPELQEQLAEARAEIERLSSRDGNASHELVYDDGDSPFAREKLEHVDFGVCDNQYVLESHLLNNALDALKEVRAEIERLALEIENKQYTITCASEENQQLKESLAEARTEIERLNKKLRLLLCEEHFEKCERGLFNSENPDDEPCLICLMNAAERGGE